MQRNGRGLRLGEDYAQVLHVHDEAQFNTTRKADALGKTFRIIELAGRHFGMRCPTTESSRSGRIGLRRISFFL